MDKERGLLIDEGAIFHQEQIRERHEQYQVKLPFFFFRKIFSIL
jgi:hypothetical protein